MPLTTTSNREDYVATSGQTVFAYTFRVDLAADFEVYQNEVLLTLTTDYTVDGLGVAGGGNVTLVVGATSGDTIIILRIVPLTQLSNYVANEGFPSARVESDYEKLTMMAQQQSEKIGTVRHKLGVALGGGAAPTLGTIGGSGPATAAQNKWLEITIDESGTLVTYWIPVWR